MQTGALDLAAQAVLAAAAVAYLTAAAKVGRRWSWYRSVCFVAGLAVVWVAVASPLAAYDDTRVEYHVVQHLLLMMLAPPLLVLGRPLVLLARVTGRRGKTRIARLTSSRAVHWITNPVGAWAVYLLPMAVSMTDRGVYRYLVTHDGAHEASHVVFLAAGTLYWETLLGPSALRLPPPLRVISILANMPFEALVGIWVRYQTAPLGPTGSVADTQAGGEAFVVGATLLSTIWLAVVVAQWAIGALREERGPRVASTEWSTPWWITEAAAGPAPGRPAGPAVPPT